MEGLRDIYLIRHGESEANAGVRTNWPDPVPLTEKGHRQSERTAQLFETLRPDQVVMSPFIRTQQTAEPLLRRFPQTPTEIWPIQEFTYLSATAFFGTTHEDRRPHFQAYWERADPDYIAGDGAESYAMMVGRVRAARRRLAALPEGRTLVYCHAYFLKMLMWVLLFSPDGDHVPDMMGTHGFVKAWTWPNAALLRCRLYADGHFYLGRMQMDHVE